MKNNWQTKTLGEVCEIMKGRKPVLKAAASGGDMPYLVAKVLRGDSGAAEFASLKDRNAVTVSKDEIIIICDGSNSGEVFTGFDGILSSTMGKVIHKGDLDNDWLMIFLDSTFVHFNSSKTGSAIPHLDKELYYRLDIPVPPLPEQRRIVAILDDVFERVAKAKANAEKNLANAKEVFESYLQKVFAEPGKDWVEMKIKDIGRTQTGLTPPTANKNYYGGDVPFIKPADVDPEGDGTIRYDNESLSKAGLEAGRKIDENSVLMVCIGATITKTGFANREVSCNQQINTLTPNSKYEPKLFYYILRTDRFKKTVIKESSQATLPIINKGKWESLIINFPSTSAEQRTIVSNLDALSTETKQLEAIYRQKLSSLEELKKSVLRSAFRGEL